MTYYEILQINKNASLEEINKAFRELAKKYHPDLNKEANAQRNFINIYEAYSILKDPIKRAAYDNKINYQYNTQKTYEYSSNEKTQQNTKDYDDYEKWRENARNEGKKYSETSFEDFKQKVLNKIIEIAKTTATVGAYTGILLLDGIIRLIIRFAIIAVISGICIGLFYLCMSQKNNQEIARRQQIQQERNIQYEGIINNKSNYIITYPDKAIPFDLKDKKIVILENNMIDAFFYDLPKEFQATKDEEVDYIIQLFRENNKIGTYHRSNSRSNNSTDTPAYQIIYKYNIVDYRNKVTVYGKLEKGTEPPRVISHSGPGYGSNPKNEIKGEILSWLNNGTKNMKNNFLNDDVKIYEEEKEKLNEIWSLFGK